GQGGSPVVEHADIYRGTTFSVAASSLSKRGVASARPRVTTGGTEVGAGQVYNDNLGSLETSSPYRHGIQFHGRVVQSPLNGLDPSSCPAPLVGLMATQPDELFARTATARVTPRARLAPTCDARASAWAGRATAALSHLELRRVDALDLHHI